jgi:hypothetical protein
MSEAATPFAGQPTRRRGLDRARAGLATVAAAVLGAAPHVLHHVGPLAGAALLAGSTGKLLFGALGFLLAIPLLRRVRQRTGSWAIPGGVFALMAVVFTFSSFVIGPALTGADDQEPTSKPSSSPSETQPAEPRQPAQPTPDEHESHHP